MLKCDPGQYRCGDVSLGPVSPTIDFARVPPEDGHEKRNQEMKKWNTQKTALAEGVRFRHASGLYLLGVGIAKLTIATPQAMRGPT